VGQANLGAVERLPVGVVAHAHPVHAEASAFTARMRKHRLSPGLCPGQLTPVAPRPGRPGAHIRCLRSSAIWKPTSLSAWSSHCKLNVVSSPAVRPIHVGAAGGLKVMAHT
jgi:hypothetical protein